MIKAGVTGGIGSGKTTVCNIWKTLGAYVLNADELAKRVMVSDPTVKEQMIDTFGKHSYHDDGTLNREYLAREAFEKGRVDELNRIVHPRLPQATRREMEKAEAQGYSVFIYEAALLLQNLQPGLLDYIVLVLADEEARIKRVQRRDNVTAEDVNTRISKQQDFEEAVAKADIIIRNNGTLEELETKAKDVYKKYFISSKM